MSARRVLVVAYHFPPVGGAGVQRTVGFAKHLHSLGWDATILTAPLGDSLHAQGVLDETLAKHVAPTVGVLRVDRPEPDLSAGWRDRGERWLRLRRPWSQWWVECATEAADGVDGVDVVYASMSPYESAEIAAAIAARLRVPWVADLRDPWALDEMQVFPSRWHRALETRRMRSLLRTAAYVVMNTKEAALEVAERFPELADRVTAIPNGFDEDDFRGPGPEIDPDIFRVVYTGGPANLSIGRRYRSQRMIRSIVGGGSKGVDLLPRSVAPLLEATERLLARRPDLRGYVKVEVAGGGSSADAVEFSALGGIDRGYLSHAASVELVRSADLLFLAMHGLEPGYRANTVPGKTYEYIASGRPILASVPAGDARDLLGRLDNVVVSDPSDVEALSRAIEAEADRKRERGVPAATVSSRPSELERGHLARELALVLDKVVDGERSTATTQSIRRKRAGAGARA